MPGLNPNIPHPLITTTHGLAPKGEPATPKAGPADPASAKSPTVPNSPAPSTSSSQFRPLGGPTAHDGRDGTKGPMSFNAMPFLAQVPGNPGELAFNEGAAKTASSFKTYTPGKLEPRSAGSGSVVSPPAPFNPLDLARADARKSGLDFPFPGTTPTTSEPTTPISPLRTRTSSMSVPNLLTIPERNEGKPIPGPTTFNQIGVTEVPEKKTKWYDPRTWGSKD